MRIKFLNTQVDNITMDEAVDEIDRLITQKVHSYAVTPKIILCLLKRINFLKKYMTRLI